MQENISMKEKNDKQHKKINIMFLLLLAIIMVAYFVSRYAFQFMLIQGDSMLPTYHNMQLVLLNKYDTDYEVGDVVAINCTGLNAIIVKRIDAIYPEGYYVLGDNREHSVDSRDERVGIIEPGSIIGKVI